MGGIAKSTFAFNGAIMRQIKYRQLCNSISILAHAGGMPLLLLRSAADGAACP